MSHFQQLKYVEILSKSFPQLFENKKVLEVGSWDANGSVRQFFKNCDYLGVDIGEGPGVDLVCRGENIDLPDASFDVVISCECFEHNPFWKETFLNMLRLLKPEGLCIITCATLGRSEHGTKRTNADASLTAIHNYDDYYANLKPSDFKKFINFNEIFYSHHFFTNVYSKDLYFFGIKRGSNSNNNNYDSNSNITKQINEIRKNRPVRLLSRLNYICRFYLKYVLACILGEKNYHDFRYKLRQKFASF
jgi:SAM-dependent methyltransferase